MFIDIRPIEEQDYTIKTAPWELDWHGEVLPVVGIGSNASGEIAVAVAYNEANVENPWYLFTRRDQPDVMDTLRDRRAIN